MTTIESDRQTETAQSADPIEYRQVWDWPVRLFHWALVFAFVGAFVTNKLGVRYFSYHVWCGYAVIVLVVFRILWGVFGTRHARFVNFVQGPIGVLKYLSAVGRGRRTRYVGHNPLGAMMVIFLIFTLAVQAGLGLFASDEIFNIGPLYGVVSKSVSLQLTSLHRKFFYWIAAAVLLHIAAVLFHVVFKREALIRAMFTGGKAGHVVRPEEVIGSSRGWLAVTLFVAVAIALVALVHSAPLSDLDVAGF
jgi:cytochrome b